MNRTLGVLAAALVLALPGAALAQSKTGTTLGQFLLIEPSARVTGMGNAGATLQDEIQAAYYNPAAIGHLARLGVQFTHAEWFADISYDYAGVAVPLGGDRGTLFGSVTALNSGDIDVRTVSQPLGTGERYSVSDIAFGLGYGRRITHRFAVGVQVHYVQETIWHSSANAMTLSAGTLFELRPGGLEIGSSLTHYGTSAAFSGRDLRITYDQDPDAHGDNSNLPGELFAEEFSVPVLFRVGLGLPVRLNQEHLLRFAVDAFHPSDNTESVSLGGEWAWRDLLALRLGYQNLFLEDSELGLTWGAGLEHGIGDYRLQADYGWAGHDRLGGTHRFTLGVSY